MKHLVTEEENIYSPPKDPVTFGKVEVRVGEESSTGILSSQNNDIMVEHVEGEALSKISLEV